MDLESNRPRTIYVPRTNKRCSTSANLPAESVDPNVVNKAGRKKASKKQKDLKLAAPENREGLLHLRAPAFKLVSGSSFGDTQTNAVGAKTQNCKAKKKKRINRQKQLDRVSELSKGHDFTGRERKRDRAHTSVTLKTKVLHKFNGKTRRTTVFKTRSFDVDDVKYLKETCCQIEMVFENRNSSDTFLKFQNHQILNNMFSLVSTGGDKESQHENIVRYISMYLRKNSSLLYGLVYLISDCEDFKTCAATISLLYELLINNEEYNECDRVQLRKVLECSNVYVTLVESMYLFHARFSPIDDFKLQLPYLECKLLNTVVTLCKTKQQRRRITSASAETIGLMSKFMGTLSKTKEFSDDLMEMVKLMSTKKKNCEVMISKKFLNGLCSAFRLTRKAATLIMILKNMSRCEYAVNVMSGHDKTFAILLELINYTKKCLNKVHLLATLLRITRQESGLKILSRDDMYCKLFHFFVRSDKTETSQSSLIKAYSMLNRAIVRTVIPTKKLNVYIELPEDVKQCLEAERHLDDGGIDNDESEDDTQDEESDDNECKDDPFHTTVSKHSREQQEEEMDNEFESSLCLMIPYFSEHVYSTDEKLKFDLFDNVTASSAMHSISGRVSRCRDMNYCAFPDAVMLEPQYDDTIFNPSVTDFSKDGLVKKLKNLKGVYEQTFTPRVVYELDWIYKNAKRPPQIPQPQSFVIKNPNDVMHPYFNNGLMFDSRFECGNLRKATQVGKYEYDLFMNPDTNTTRGFHWFYFQVSNMIHGTRYVFNIVNFLKSNSQFNYGMQPMMFSVVDYITNKVAWKRIGHQIMYYGNNYTNESGNNQYKSLTFSVCFKYVNDYVYFAYHYPYTYTRLMCKLCPLLDYKSSNIFVKLHKLCNTITNRNEFPLLTITGLPDSSESLGIPLHRRPIVFITARVHPGETNSSWIMEGIIAFLLDETDANAFNAREHYIFKIIPMLNPEGVIYGNTRTSLTGKDLNRCWNKPNKTTNPEIYNAKSLIACARKELRLPIAFYIDIHGHSRKKFFFFYGCNPKQSWNKSDHLKAENPELLKMLPETIRDVNPHIKLEQCRYKVVKCRESTGRVVMWREFDINHSYTLECSYSFVKHKQFVSTKVLTDIGASVVTALGKIAIRARSSNAIMNGFCMNYGQQQPCNFPESEEEAEKTRSGSLGEEVDNASSLLELSQSVLNGARKVSNRRKLGTEKSQPLFVSSRVFETNVATKSD